MSGLYPRRLQSSSVQSSGRLGLNYGRHWECWGGLAKRERERGVYSAGNSKKRSVFWSSQDMLKKEGSKEGRERGYLTSHICHCSRFVITVASQRKQPLT